MFFLAAARSEVEPLNSDPSAKMTDEIRTPMIRTNDKESSGDVDYSTTPEEEVKSKSLIHISEPVNNTRSAPQAESDTPYFVKDQRENIDLAHNHEEHERKKSGFSRIFSRRKKDKGPGIVDEEPDSKKTIAEEKILQDMNGERKDQRIEKIESKKRSGGKEDQGKRNNEKIIYLTDEDIEDLK